MATMADGLNQQARYEAPRSNWATVRVETATATYVGRLYVPETTKAAFDPLGSDDAFLSMAEVTINGSEHVEPFLKLNKSLVRTVRVLHGGLEAPLARTR